MKNIKGLNFFDKKIILRCDLNIPIEKGQIVDDIRIRMALKSVNNIIAKKPKVLIITSHLGRPAGKFSPELSLKVIFEYLKKEISGINFIERIEDIKDIDKGIFLLENLRFWSGEENNDDNFSKKIAENFDVYINDAFSVSHRDHASIVGFPNFIKQKYAGLLFSEEYKNLIKIRDNPESPAVAVIGGAKIETKLPVINNLLKKYAFILLGGKVANEALDEKKDLGEKVILPIDFSPKNKIEQRLDIGPETINKFKDKINNAKTIVWNGPLGKFENKDAEKGTCQIMKAIIDNHKANRILGGGETLEAVKKFGNLSDFNYVSMSGGSMLEFLSGKELPGIKALD